MPKARLYFDGDNSGIEKEARIYSLTQEVEDKLDSISDFQDEIDGLQEQINNLASRGRYLSTWDCVTGLPGTDPQVDPYVYRAGDYYIVSNVGGTNLRPAGAEYHVQVPSQVVESQSVSQNDLYIYDGIQWVLQQSGSSLYAVWGSITGTLSAQTDLQTALDNKANITDVNTKTFYIDWSGSLAQRIQEAQAAYDYWLAGGNPIIAIDDGADDGYYILEKVWNGTATFSSPRLTKVNQPGGYTFVTKPGIILTLSGNTVTNVDSQSLNQFYYIDTFATYTNPFAPTQSYHPTSKKYVDNNDTFIGTTAPTDNLVEGRLWYDTANDVLKVYNGTQWNATGGGSDIEYVTQAEYNALLPGALTDNKHYFIYTEDDPTPPVLNERPDLDQYSLLTTKTLSGFNNPHGIAVSEDGTKLFIGPGIGNQYQYTMTGGLLSNISAVESTSSSITTRGLYCKPDGTKLFSLSDDGSKRTITMPTPFSFSGSSDTNSSGKIGSQEPTGCWFTPDGDYYFTCDGGGSVPRNTLYKIPLGTPRDFSTATTTGMTSIYLNHGNRLYNVAISPTGLKMFIGGWGGSCYIYQYNLSTPRDITTATYSGKSLGSWGRATFSVTGTGSIFVTDTEIYTPTVYQYTAS